MSCKPGIPSCVALLVALFAGCGGEAAQGRDQDPAPGSARPAESPAEQAAAEPPQQPEVPPPPSEFLRFVPVGEDEGRFESAITTYENDDGQRVALVAAVHIADARHYRELQRAFESYDRVLYELVAGEEDRPKPGEPRPSRAGVIGGLQRLMKGGLELEFQLDAIDYTVDNFVHADLTPEAFAAKMEERGETFFTMFWRLFSQQMAAMQRMQEDGAGEGEEPRPRQSFDLVSAFRRGEGRHMMRMMMAQSLEHAEMMAGGAGSGENEGTVLLEGRNERAIAVLREQLGEGYDDLAIYYGAAHMPGIERALLEDLGFEKVGHRWLVAWDISKRPDPVRERK